MKKLTLIVSALALVLGLAQCAKKPNMPVIGGLSTSTKTITFTTNGGGDKGEFEQDLNKQLNYKWDANDIIHVFATTSETDGFVEGYAKYCGAIGLTDGEGTTDATFEGKIELPDGVKKLRFFHYGQSLSTTDGSLTADYSTQTGALKDVSDKVVAMCEIDANDENNYNCKLDVQFAVARIDLSNLTTTDNVKMINIKSNGFTVDKYGNITLNKGKEVNIGSANLTNYYLIAMKEAPGTHHTFIATGKTRYANFISAMVNNVYYTDNGNAKKIDLLPENSMPAAFSIDGTNKVHFADGNLAYNSTKTPTWFMLANQWDYIKEWGNGIDIDHFYWTKDNFGTKAQYEKGDETGEVDWGGIYCNNQNPTLASGTWNVLSKDEWKYIIERKNANGVLMNAMVTINSVYGLVIVPDCCDLNPATINTEKELKDNYCLFLPASGYREYIDGNVEFTKCGTHGLSWSKNEVDANLAYSMDFDEDAGGAYIWPKTRKNAGCCVRLVTKK